MEVIKIFIGLTLQFFKKPSQQILKQIENNVNTVYENKALKHFQPFVLKYQHFLESNFVTPLQEFIVLVQQFLQDESSDFQQVQEEFIKHLKSHEAKSLTEQDFQLLQRIIDSRIPFESFTSFLQKQAQNRLFQ